MKPVLLPVKFVLVFSFMLFYYPASAASNKTIYIRPFVAGKGIVKSDAIGEKIKDFISEGIIDRGGYSLTSDEEVKQVMKQEEARMAFDACYDDACIRKLMESLQTDFIIYGNVSFEDGRYNITAKMLDRSTGKVKLARVKSLQFKDRNKLKMASLDLADYLITEKTIDMKRYDDAYQDVISSNEKRVPAGLAVSFVYFTPLKSPFKDYYDSLIGGSLDYYHKINDYLALGAGVNYVQGDDNTGDVTVSLNSYSIGVRAGIPLAGFLYPYISLSAEGIWFNEKGTSDSVSYAGFGAVASAGCAVVLIKQLSIFADYSYSYQKLIDDAGNDISGTVIRGGAMYRF